jgi:peptide-methionine (S)-S-oxide reductase
VGIFGFRKTQMVSAEDALPGRPETMPVPARHEILHTPLHGPYPEGSEIAEFALGCFWGEERNFWQVPGVFTTAVGYEGGFTPNPTYEEVCSGRTGHAETVRVVYEPAKVSYQQLLKVFWESHDAATAASPRTSPRRASSTSPRTTTSSTCTRCRTATAPTTARA